MSEYLQSELPAIELFKKLGYRHIDAKAKMHDVILQDILERALLRLNPWLNENNLRKAIRKITTTNGSTLIEINKSFHELISKADAFTLKPSPDKPPIPVKFIDYENIENNDFLIANQMRFKGERADSIPDIVLFVNGLPLAVIEAKNQTVNITDIPDLLYYQKNSPKLFYYNQICSAINRINALYGTIESPMEFYSKYNEAPNDELKNLVSDREITPQDIMLYNLFKPERLLDIIKHFVIFETIDGKTIKKLPRYQQIRAVEKIIHRLKTEHKGGVVWHTQGSGKSITMIYLATKLRASSSGFDNPTILVVTDRIDLDTQISSTFVRTGFPNPIQAKSISDLKQQLKNSYGKTIMTTIHKFQERENEQKEVEILSEKENIFLLIDEAHRSQYGLTASYMRQSLPNAKFIAFTGTPIDKESKSTLREFYGGDYIDKYTIKQSVADGNTLPILYETGIPELFVEKEQMDEVFKRVFENVSEEKRGYLKKRTTSLDVILLAQQRIEEIAKHIITHYKNKIYPDGFKAMIVCHNRRQAIAYQKALLKLKEQGLNPYKSKVVMSFDTKKDPQEYFELATPPEEITQTIKDFKLPFGDESSQSRDGKKQYDNTAFLIVSDMLLTGYDAPILQVLYLDKVLKEHNLLQAIARVNRTRKGKYAGYVVDFVGITKHLSQALEIFSGDLEPSDVMRDIESEKSRLENRHSKIVSFFKKIKYDRYDNRNDFIFKAVEYLQPQDIKEQFRELLRDFNKSMDIVLPDPFAQKFEYDFKLFNEIKLIIREEREKITQEESGKLQMIIDEHLRSKGIEYLLKEPIDISDYKQFRRELEKSSSHNPIDKAKAIIKANKSEHPELALELSELLEKMLIERKSDRKEAIANLFNQMEEIINRHKERYIEVGLKDRNQLVVYNIVEKLSDKPTELTLEIYEVLKDFLANPAVYTKSTAQKEMRNRIKPLLAKYGIDRKISKDIVQKLVES